MTARLNPEAPRRGFALGPTWAPTCPPRPMLSRRKPAGQVAALRIPFFFFFFPCSDRREKHPGDLGLAEAVKQTSAGGKDGRTARRRGRERASGARPRPARARPPPFTVLVAARETAAAEAEGAPPLHHRSQTRLTWTCPRHSRQ